MEPDTWFVYLHCRPLCWRVPSTAGQDWGALVSMGQGLGASGNAHRLDFRSQNLLKLSTVTVKSFCFLILVGKQNNKGSNAAGTASSQNIFRFRLSGLWIFTSEICWEQDLSFVVCIFSGHSLFLSASHPTPHDPILLRGEETTALDISEILSPSVPLSSYNFRFSEAVAKSSHLAPLT